ncbi:MAG: isocitrate/isopropylmalate dehydrogenase family protein [Clostridia bacterium]|nr:isocitrate/isopropylmalate dehydrogenase family protein [Clostridia bacterium]MBQ1895823.1 isocitrate/isopropylmalate dehydrogenase family protein [Clostridia bacterium]MBQ2091724.1 isocitrate/isopropylmalate dehydrogenase family protein [Clostridia bacterium]
MDYIESAVEHFRGLLTEQLERCERMEKDTGKTDFSSMDEIKIGICGGDGIGPIITNEAMRLLSFLLEDDVASGKIKFKVIDGLTIENREACGKAIPDDVLAELKECPVILKGPTTTPKGGTMESANVAMRRELDLYANVRPVQVPSEGIDWIFFRENTEGEYVLGSKGIEIPDKLAFDFKVTTNPGTKRIVRAACEYARANGKTNLAIVTKANIMKKTDGKFSLLAHEIADEYPELTAEDWYIDIMTANLVNEARRSEFQVFVLPNLYGDIITDEAAQIQGGVGTAGSANIGDRYAMFEAIHGSAPRMIERGDGDYANPASMFKAAEMLLRHIGYADKADLLSKAMNICLETEKKITITGRSNGATCKEFGDYVMDTVKSLER